MTQSTLRVLLTADAVGGIWQYATGLASALDAQGIEPIIAVLGPPPSAAQLTSAKGVRVIVTGLPLDWLSSGAEPVLAAGLAIAQLAAHVHADCVQLNMPILAARAKFDMPIIAVVHGCIATWWQAAHGTAPAAAYLWHTELMAEGLCAADLIVAPTRAYGSTVRNLYRLNASPVTIHNGRRLQLADPAASMPDQAFTAGRLWDRAKNTAVLDRVAARLGFPFFAAGPSVGPHGETIELHALRLLGTLDEPSIAARLAYRPVFVSVAKFEPFGLAVLEAASAGCALVLSDIASFRELWDGAAVFVPEDDDARIADAINKIMGDREMRMTLGNAARGRAATYTPEGTAAGMMELYRRLVPQDSLRGEVAA